MMNLLSENHIAMISDFLAYHPDTELDQTQLLIPIIKYHERFSKGVMEYDDFTLKYPKTRRWVLPQQESR